MPKAVKIIFIAAVMATFIIVRPAESVSTYRCRHRLVSVGDRMFEVEEKCGKPKSKDVISEVKVKTRHLRKTELVEEWLYDIRYGWWDVLTFRGSRLVRIESIKK
jgi:hypothetical protein